MNRGEALQTDSIKMGHFSRNEYDFMDVMDEKASLRKCYIFSLPELPRPPEDRTRQAVLTCAVKLT